MKPSGTTALAKGVAARALPVVSSVGLPAGSAKTQRSATSRTAGSASVTGTPARRSRSRTALSSSDVHSQDT
jgi:hypothetical protein